MSLFSAFRSLCVLKNLCMFICKMFVSFLWLCMGQSPSFDKFSTLWDNKVNPESYILYVKLGRHCIFINFVVCVAKLTGFNRPFYRDRICHFYACTERINNLRVLTLNLKHWTPGQLSIDILLFRLHKFQNSNRMMLQVWQQRLALCFFYMRMVHDCYFWEH